MVKTSLLFLVSLALMGCDSGAGRSTQKMKIRKQVYNLTVADLSEHPVWEFAEDEEGAEGQDEATVRPLVASTPLDPNAGNCIVRARFTLADGTRLVGYFTPCRDQNDLGRVQPQIITDRGQVPFWMGIARADVAPLYAKLGKSADQTFPVSFESDFPLVGKTIKGTIPAFLRLEDLASGRIKEIR
jgi:hypothetical protein